MAWCCAAESDERQRSANRPCRIRAGAGVWHPWRQPPCSRTGQSSRRSPHDASLRLQEGPQSPWRLKPYVRVVRRLVGAVSTSGSRRRRWPEPMGQACRRQRLRCRGMGAQRLPPPETLTAPLPEPPKCSLAVRDAFGAGKGPVFQTAFLVGQHALHVVDVGAVAVGMQ